MNNLQFLKHHFGTKTDKSQVPGWQHAVWVSETLQEYLQKTNETPENIQTLIYAALGHDLLEDTNCSEQEIEQQWGKETLALIKNLTNKVGDHDFRQYIQNLQKANEDTLLVKLADLKANTGNSILCKDILGEKWFKDFWIPLIEKYLEAFESLERSQFPKTIDLFLKDITKDLDTIKKLNF